MVFQVKRCPNCHRIYESGQYREKIGKPVVTCPFCLTRSIDKSTNEWQLLSIGGTISYFFITILSIWGNGIVLGMVALLLLLLPDIFFKTKLSDFIISSGGGIITFGCIFIGAMAIYIIVREARDIAASIARMKDPDYRATLEAAGVIKTKK